MQSDDVLGRNGHIGQCTDRKRRCICGDDRFRPGFHRQLPKNLFLHVDFLRGGFNDKLHIAQFHRRRRPTNPGAALLCFFFRHQSALHSIGVSFLNVCQTAVDLFSSDVAKDHSDAARTEPLCDAGPHHTGADHSRVNDFFRRRSRGSFLVFFCEEEITDQILARFRFAEIHNRVELQSQ